MRTLCLYYTRTNTTKEIMENIAGIIGADVAEYTDGKDRSGFLGYAGACFATVKNTISKVSIRGEINLKEYDRLVIGMPVWVEGPCAVGRALIKKFGGVMPSEVYYVVTHMGDKHDYAAKIKAMDKLLGRPSAGQISIRTKENDYIKESAAFAETLV
jgi:flavodoxin